jgi:hypothetical protein
MDMNILRHQCMMISKINLQEPVLSKKKLIFIEIQK